MIEYKSIAISTILSDSDSNPLRLVVPNFQREYVWERESQKNLLASFLIGIPIGSLLIIKGSNNEFSSKRICFKNTISDNNHLAQECNYLLDGQQRISTIRGILSNPFYHSKNVKDVEYIYENLYAKLRTRWLLRIKPTEHEEDLWGFNSLYFDPKLLYNKEPSDIIPFIDYKLDIKNQNSFYSPAHEIKQRSDSPNEWLNNLANSFAENSYLPLWELSNNSTLFDSIIDKIADSARQKIADDYTTAYDKQVFINDLKSKNLDARGKDFNDLKRLDTTWSDLRGEWKSKLKSYLTSTVLDQKISVIDLPKDEIARATIIFENLNRGGTPLSTFDLIVAKAFDANSTQSLRDLIIEKLKDNLNKDDSTSDWNGVLIGAIEDRNEDLHKETKDQFLNLLSIITYSYNEINHLKVDHIKKHSLLSLDINSVNNYKEPAVINLKRSFLFFQERLGVCHLNDISYKLMILPIAFIMYKLGDNWKNKRAWNKLEYWYWLSLFSGRYREKQNERCIEDIKDLYYWVFDENNVFDTSRFNLTSNRFRSILSNENYNSQNDLKLKNPDYKPSNAVKNSILQYELSKKPRDLYIISHPNNCSSQSETDLVNRTINSIDISKNKYDIEVHHIIPLSSATSIGQSTRAIRADRNNILNSPLNLTLISKDANRIISDYSPMEYLGLIRNNVNNIPIYNHHIPNDDELLNNLSTEEGKQVFLDRRYQLLKQSIDSELSELFNN
jgi:hypothetical protein